MDLAWVINKVEPPVTQTTGRSPYPLERTCEGPLNLGEVLIP